MGSFADAPLPVAPDAEAVRSLSRPDDADPGTVVWHRSDLRIADHPAVAAAADESDRILPLFVFDPGFHDARGAACDARIAFLHDCLRDLDRQYRDVDGAGLTYAHGDPIEVLSRFVDAGWDAVTSATATGRYGRRRDERARERLGVEFVDGDGLVRDADRPRADWSDRVEAWLAAEPFDWDPRSVAVERVETGITPERVADAYGVEPTKTRVPTGGREAGRERLHAFTEEIAEYPGSISSPVDARDGTSGLSPYLRFGCLSVREVHRHVDERAPDGRGKSMFVSRLYWNRHYTQKLLDWPGWLDRAVNPVYEEFNRDRHDPDLVAAWKDGETGFPMVDASMRCLRETGWLNFRMRALCASVYFHILQQPWRIGADHFYEHLIDGDPAINYTQWQSQCGLVGRPGLRLYDPRKQIRDQDPDGEFVSRWVPELAPLPAAHLDAPEKAPLAVQREVGVRIGETYPYPVVDYEAARSEFRERYGAAYPAAAERLGEEAIARRASLSGGLGAAESIAADHGEPDTDPGTGSAQAALDEFE
ncbi:deoxyribodipyrimidine photo-lyase/cryptochrome family protein [Halorubrum sp. ASP1]|uniref:FAD-binding domain-containing protein n=1 Tax=Halorubrum sp. ASP1 TaxID=2518114 RepID=UPI0010F59336|nr:cryptochrome/deoxyribodipyrimidine photo-lyase family protein [Halorubrum sp. ASP1]TKX58346.1 deoxyribodipyrimidine photo-lyase/cryptochrome family protein [Halorubrum sp. ASP1]